MELIEPTFKIYIISFHCITFLNLSGKDKTYNYYAQEIS